MREQLIERIKQFICKIFGHSSILPSWVAPTGKRINNCDRCKRMYEI